MSLVWCDYPALTSSSKGFPEHKAYVFTCAKKGERKTHLRYTELRARLSCELDHGSFTLLMSLILIFGKNALEASC